MELDPKERGLVEVYLSRSAEPNMRWALCLVAGLLACLAMLAVVALTPAGIQDAPALLGLVLGLVVMSRALEDRNRTLLASIIQKYERAVTAGKTDEQ